jgi:hypothetical protein
MIEAVDSRGRETVLDPQIVDAANRGSLVLFVGAGVSRLVGCTGWGDLATDLLDMCYKRHLVDYRTSEELKSLPDHRQLITVCYHMLVEAGQEGLFNRKLSYALKPHGPGRERVDVFRWLSKIPSYCVVTTNADTLLDTYFKGKVVSKAKDFPLRPEPGFLYHLHGSAAQPKSIVFTLAKYFDQYERSKGNKIPLFLENLFGEFNILFLGYGLSEFEILEFIFRRPANPSSNPFRHFLLLGDSDDGLRKSCMQSYYKDMSIKLVSYTTDIRGYDELYYVIRDWSGQLGAAERYARLPDEQEQLKKFATRVFDPSTMERVWNLLQRFDLRPFFFSTLSDSGYEICRSWLVPLSQHNCFSPADHPSLNQGHPPGVAGEAYWGPIGYLHTVTKSAIEMQDTEALVVISEIGVALAQVLISAPTTEYDWRTGYFILQALAVSQKSLLVPAVSSVFLSLARATSNSLLLGIALSGELIKLLVSRGNRMALMLILKASIDKMCQEQSDSGLNEVAWHFEKTIVPLAGDLVRVCGPKSVSMSTEALRNWQHGQQRFDVTYGWVRSIEESSQNKSTDYSVPMAVVRFVRVACDELPPQQRQDIARRLLKSRASILRRLGYYLTNAHYNELMNLFWQGKRNPLLDEDAYHEVYLLFCSHAHEMNGEQAAVFLHWLINGESEWGRQVSSEGPSRASLKKGFREKWLLPMEMCTDARIKALFKRNWAERERPEHPEWNFYVGEVERDNSGIVVPSTIQAFETDVELASFLNATELSSAYGALQEAVSNDPEGMIRKGLSDLASVPIGYLQAIFYGFISGMRNDRPFEVAPVLRLGESLLNRLQMPLGRAESEGDRRSACRSICELISAGVRQKPMSWTEDSVLTQDLLEKAVMVALANPVTDSGLREQRWRRGASALASAIEATALVAWGLTGVERQSGNSDSHMPTWVAAMLDRILDNTDSMLAIEVREGTAAALYILNIVDSGWVSANLDRIFPMGQPDVWDPAFAAYLPAPVYEDLFHLLLDRGVYSFAIQRDSADERIDQALAAHVCLAYISDLDDGLMDEMLARGGKNRVGEIVWYFASRDTQWTDEGRKRLMQLWPQMIEAIGRIADQSDKNRLMMGLPAWLAVFQTLPDSAEELLEKSFEKWIPYQSSSEPDILESLARFVDKDPERVGNIMLTALKDGAVLTYPEEALVKIAETLCQKRHCDVAESIHAAYSEKGVWILLPVLEECRKRQQSGSQVP